MKNFFPSNKGTRNKVSGQRRLAEFTSNGPWRGLWAHLSVRSQLLLAVNLTLAVLLAGLLVFDYRREMEQAIADKHAALQDEAVTIQRAAAHLGRRHKLREVQDYIDAVCRRMRENTSPGHHIVVRAGGKLFQARAHGRDSEEIVEAMRNARDSSGHQATFGGRRLVVGSFAEDGVQAYVSEYTEHVRRAARSDVLLELGGAAFLGLVAIVLVNVILRRIVTRPLKQLVSTVGCITEGKFGVQTGPFHSRDMNRLAEAVNTMSVSLEETNKSRQRQIARARRVQENLLPGGVEVPGLKLAHRFRPAEGVAGDFFDILPLPDGSWLLCIADVTGHGVPAAFQAAMLKALLQHAAERQDNSPSAILGFVNERFLQTALPGEFVTMFLARWQPEAAVLEYASAGHEPQIYHAGNGTRRLLKATGLFVGVQQDSFWRTKRVQVKAGDRLLLATDGLSETADAHGRLFGRERVAALLAETREAPLRETLERIEESAAEFRGGREASDDLTLLLLEFSPSGVGTLAEQVSHSHTTSQRVHYLEQVS